MQTDLQRAASNLNLQGVTTMISIRNFIALLAAVFALNAFAAVDVNKASQAELETVKGIGPGLSAKILKAREAGTFKNWDDLVERVSGVGPGNATRFSQAGLTVGGSNYDGQAAAAQGTKTAKAAKSEKSEKADKADKTDKPAKDSKTKKSTKSETPAA
jgi:competence protein ComEA